MGKKGKTLKNKQGAIETEMLGWWIIGIAVLVILVIGLFILSGKGSNAIEYIKSMFRFR